MFKKLSIVFLLIFSTFFMMSCSTMQEVKVRVGLKNKDFEYIKQGKIKKIIIQNNRDKGFKFIVKDTQAIKDLYDILSSAREVEKKSSLEPDYTFEMYEKGGKVHKFNYAAGLDKQDDGNFYSDDKVYIISKRIDNDIIKNFWNIRKPKFFEDVYYDSILAVLDKYIQNNNYENISINIKEDLDVAKFIFSTDLEELKLKLENEYSNVELMNNKARDVVMKVKTEGYKSTVYKSIVTYSKDNNTKDKKYYVIAKYNEDIWDIKVYEDEKPIEF